MGAKNTTDLTVSLFFSAGFCKEDIDTGDLSRAGPAYEAMEDKNKTVATWSFDVHPLCGYISKKAKISKVNHGCKSGGKNSVKRWNRAENEWLPGSVCWYCSLGVSSTCPWYRELPKTCQGRWSWRLAFKFQVHKSSPKNTCCGKCDQHVFRWLNAMSIPLKF